MKSTTTVFEGVLLLEPTVYSDDRGVFFESFQQTRFSQLLPNTTFVQDNVSVSKKGVIRGLHHQWRKPQGKLVTVLSGSVFDVVVDIRIGSPTFRRWLSFDLNAENRHLLYIPPGFAHGFQAITDNTIFSYRCTDFYDSGFETTIKWNDPELSIPWPLPAGILSAKDQQGVSF